MESADNSKSVTNFRFSTVPLDTFIIDIDHFSITSTDEISHNSTISRNFSGKGTLNKIGQVHDHAGDNTGEFVSSIGGVVLGAVSTVEKKAVVMELGSGEKLGGGGGGGVERPSLRRNSFKRSTRACSWYLNPRNIFLLCATLGHQPWVGLEFTHCKWDPNLLYFESCVGTMVLIYLAISSGTMNVADEISQLDS